MSQFAPCPGCARHVRAGEDLTCPFCGGDTRGVIAPQRKPGRLTRAAMVLGGALLVPAAIGCGGGSSASDEPVAEDTSGDEALPPPDDQSSDPPPEDGPPPDDSPVAMYGAPSADVLV
jgi:hypothetical protein